MMLIEVDWNERFLSPGKSPSRKHFADINWLKKKKNVNLTKLLANVHFYVPTFDVSARTIFYQRDEQLKVMTEYNQYHKARICADSYLSAVHHNISERDAKSHWLSEMDKDYDCDYNGVRGDLISPSFNSTDTQLLSIKNKYGINSYYCVINAYIFYFNRWSWNASRTLIKHQRPVKDGDNGCL